MTTQERRRDLVRKIFAEPTLKPSAGDEADLRLYFDRGVDFFAPPSNFGIQMEQAELFWGELRPCKECGGRDAVEGDDGECITEQGGSGFVWDSKAWKQRKIVALITGREAPLPGDLVCGKCKGRGWIRRGAKARTPTVQRTGSSVNGSSAEPGGNIERMERFGRIDRILYRVHRRDPISWCALAVNYAPDGSEEALWVLTAIGREWFATRSIESVNERQFFENEKDLQHRQPTIERAERIAEARQQSRNLLLGAWALWSQLKR